MTKITWTDEFSVGVKSLDDQHIKLLDEVNRLLEDRDKMINALSIADHFKSFNKLIDEHFEFEEKLLSDHQYRDFDNHKFKHRYYHERFSEFLMNAIWDKQQTVDDICKYLVAWWTNHVLKEDMKYKEFFISKGIK